MSQDNHERARRDVTGHSVEHRFYVVEHSQNFDKLYAGTAMVFSLDIFVPIPRGQTVVHVSPDGREVHSEVIGYDDGATVCCVVMVQSRYKHRVKMPTTGPYSKSTHSQFERTRILHDARKIVFHG